MCSLLFSKEQLLDFFLFNDFYFFLLNCVLTLGKVPKVRLDFAWFEI